MALVTKGRPSFCVVGAGINGLATACSLAKRFHGCRLVITSDKFSPCTTSNNGFGICSIRGLDELDHANAVRWTKSTTAYCDSIIKRNPSLAKEMGLQAVEAFLVFDRMKPAGGTSPPRWDTFSFRRKLDEVEVDALGMSLSGLDHVFERKGVSKEDLEVINAGTWVIDTNLYLPWMRNELESLARRGEITSVEFVEKRISSFSELGSADYDFILNCSGLGSEFLVPDDKLIPIRGQYIVIDGAEQELRYGNHTFICPKSSGSIALGSVYQKGRRDTTLDPNDREDILRRCYALNPKIRSCGIIIEDVGIRPGRYGGARVELELRHLGSRASPMPVVHNYGHGPRGIMQHWGCAQEVVKLVEEHLKHSSKL